MRAKRAKAVVLAVCLAMGAFSGTVAGCKQGTPQISLGPADAVLSPMLIGVGSVFLEIANKGNAEDYLLSAEAVIPGTITELHDMQDGKMARVERMRIPPHDSVRLRPGGLHIMIFKMPRNVSEGSECILRLNFEKSGPMNVALKFAKNLSSR